MPEERFSEEFASSLQRLTAELEGSLSVAELVSLRERLPEDPGAVLDMVERVAAGEDPRFGDEKVVRHPAMPPQQKERSRDSVLIAACRRHLQRIGPSAIGATTSLALAIAFASLLFLPAHFSSAKDIFLLVASYSLGSMALRRTAPVPAAVYAVSAAAWGESIFRVAGVTVPPLYLTHATSWALWLLLACCAQYRSRAMHWIAVTGCIASASIFVLEHLGHSSGSLWLGMFALATALLTQRVFALGIGGDLRVSLAAGAYIPLSIGMPLSLFLEMSYGSMFITLSNIWTAAAPLACAGWALAVSSNQWSRETVR